MRRGARSFILGQMCETEVSAGDAGEKVDRSWQYEAPGGQEVQTPPPAVLIEDVEGPAGADRRRGSLEERRRLLPASMTMIPADRQLDEGRREVVTRLTLVEPRVGHEDDESGERERQDAHGQNLVGIRTQRA
jgi:hypothetical protein